MPLKLLAVGDLHLGRTPSRLPEALRDRARELGPAGAWEQVVGAAVEAGVDAVALAGDLVHSDHDFFEALGQLKAGVERLVASGIRVFGVVGNHDVEVLPRLAEQIEGFRLLGLGGLWERASIEADGERLILHGWSFPQRIVRKSPLDGAAFERGPGPNIGLLHGDRDQAESAYAPVTSARLRAAGLDAWLLGHIHKPDRLTAREPFGYLGSVTGLGPGEPGARGPWLLTVGGGRIDSLQQWQLAPLRWERLPVDLTGIEAPEDARERLLETAQQVEQGLASLPHPPEAVGLRVTFTGRTDLRRPVQDLLDDEGLGHLPVGDDRIHLFVEGTRYALLPLVDLALLARRKDPPGLLARRLQALGRDAADPERQELIRRARKHLQEAAGKPAWRALETGDGQDPFPEGQVAAWLEESGLAALDQLLAQEKAG